MHDMLHQGWEADCQKAGCLMPGQCTEKCYTIEGVEWVNEQLKQSGRTIVVKRTRCTAAYPKNPESTFKDCVEKHGIGCWMRKTVNAYELPSVPQHNVDVVISLQRKASFFRQHDSLKEACSKCNLTKTQHDAWAALPEDNPKRCTGTWKKNETKEEQRYVEMANKAREHGFLLDRIIRVLEIILRHYDGVCKKYKYLKHPVSKRGPRRSPEWIKEEQRFLYLRQRMVVLMDMFSHGFFIAVQGHVTKAAKSMQRIKVAAKILYSCAMITAGSMTLFTVAFEEIALSLKMEKFEGAKFGDKLEYAQTHLVKKDDPRYKSYGHSYDNSIHLWRDGIKESDLILQSSKDIIEDYSELPEEQEMGYCENSCDMNRPSTDLDNCLCGARWINIRETSMDGEKSWLGNMEKRYKRWTDPSGRLSEVITTLKSLKVKTSFQIPLYNSEVFQLNRIIQDIKSTILEDMVILPGAIYVKPSYKTAEVVNEGYHSLMQYLYLKELKQETDPKCCEHADILESIEESEESAAEWTVPPGMIENSFSARSVEPHETAGSPRQRSDSYNPSTASSCYENNDVLAD